MNGTQRPSQSRQSKRVHNSPAAEQVRARINPELILIEKPLPVDDPRQRQPDIRLAQRELGWGPVIGLEQGLEPTITWFKDLLAGTVD